MYIPFSYSNVKTEKPSRIPDPTTELNNKHTLRTPARLNQIRSALFLIASINSSIYMEKEEQGGIHPYEITISANNNGDTTVEQVL
jgi:hypothetical protein